MSIIGSELLLGAADEGGYQVERSLRFVPSRSTYLYRSTTSGNRRTNTFSAWIKPSYNTALNPILFGHTQNLSNYTYVQVVGTTTNCRLKFYSVAGGAVQFNLEPTLSLRDPTAWYHLTCVMDTTQATASDRLKIYVNGQLVTAYQIATYPSQNADTAWNDGNNASIGAFQVFLSASNFWDGYVAEMNYVEGSALSPTDFAEYDANNSWQPISYAGSYGTNGFHLNFSDNSTTSALGSDSSGNSNNFTTSGFSVTAGSNNDSLLDSPTNYGTDTGAGGEVGGNYATLSTMISVTSTYNATITEGGLKTEYTSSTKRNAYGTIAIPLSGKYYFEAVPHTNAFGGDVGLARYKGQPVANAFSGNDNILYLWNGVWQQEVNGVPTSAGGLATWSVGSAIGVAVNADAGTVSFYHNGSLQVTRTFNATGLLPYCNDQSGTGDGRGLYLNFGQRPFAYTAPSGFKALCTTNLPEPTIADGSTAMDAVLYTGNSSTQTISGLNFSPDFVWLKQRSGTYFHELYDAIRGTGFRLFTNLTNGDNATTSLTSFNSDGFSLTNTGGGNISGTTYVTWCWDAGSSTVTNNAGSISSQVRANPSAGFSIVSYTGNSTNGATVGHGLNAAPEFIFLKNRDDTWDWVLGHNKANSGTSDWNYYFTMPTTGGRTSSSQAWNNTAPTSTVFTLGNWSAVNYQSIIAYCFAPVEGYSSFGYARGNGNIDGTYVHLGFRPSFLIWKQANGSSDWYMFDNERLGFNVENAQLQMNTSASENTSDILDFYSNGFKLRTNDSTLNGASNDFIYMAFAENPFKYARGR